MSTVELQRRSLTHTSKGYGAGRRRVYVLLSRHTDVNSVYVWSVFFLKYFCAEIVPSNIAATMNRSEKKINAHRLLRRTADLVTSPLTENSPHQHRRITTVRHSHAMFLTFFLLFILLHLLVTSRTYPFLTTTGCPIWHIMTSRLLFSFWQC